MCGITSPLRVISNSVPGPILLSSINFPLKPVTQVIVTPHISTGFTLMRGFRIPCLLAFHTTSSTIVVSKLDNFLNAIAYLGFPDVFLV